MLLRAVAPLLAALAAALPAAALGWGADGHRIVAAVADERLSPAARALVDDVLGGPLHAGDVAVWADRHRDARTGPWHYVNIPFGAGGYDAARDCPGGDCIVGALERFTAQLATATSDAARADALRWLVHLVADVHQPLHAGVKDDLGGNRTGVRWGRRRQPTHLHRVWDHEVVQPVLRAHGGDPVRAAGALSARVTRADARAWAAERAPAAWANASNAWARAIYADLERRPRRGRLVLLDPSYADAQRADVEAALSRAGVRLAALLDRIAAPPPAGGRSAVDARGAAATRAP